jgi:hypothetical protein
MNAMRSATAASRRTVRSRRAAISVVYRARVRLRARGWLLVVAAAMGTVAGCSSSSGDLGRAKFEVELREQGAPATIADCIAGQLPDPVPESVTTDGERLMSLLFECAGLTSDVADCMVARIAEIVGSLEGDDFVRATQRLGQSEIRALARGSIECQGYSEAQSVCAIDGLAAEYGSALFQDVPALLTGEQQVRLQELLAECAHRDSSDENGDASDGAGGSGDSASDDSDLSDATGSAELPDGSTEDAVDAEHDMCRVVGDAIEYEGPDDADAAAIVQVLEVAVGGLRSASANANANRRQELEDAAALYETILPTFIAIDAGLSEFGTVEADAATALVEAIVPVLRASSLMLPAPNVVSDCNFAVDPGTLVDFVTVAQEFLLTEVGQRPAHDALRDMVASMNEAITRNNGQPTAGLVDAYEQCAAAPEAQQPGDDAGCDELYDACDGRNMLACNDLFWISVVGSEYERFGATCGDRTQFGREGFGGFCDELDEP